ncbi:MAG: hypothetical protein JO357_17665 [Hyphomicrobiales bacterium]|nr:hypothetical protein [Hyphomicrobiales bacterium]MBV9138882.1 hypothetical protein [Hyphomicrobiales bacterium]MBV9588212.1 hypothetical protein [Hyphomicrobiales bacterium]MBV9976604.1 hypothetical protein [Hyphomicrobiales bacterium]
MSQVVHDALGSLGGPIPAEVALNFGNLIFVEPSGIVFLSNFIHWLHVQKSTARFIGVNKETEALRFLDDSLFFEQHWKKKLRSSSRPRSTTRPLIKIAQPKSHAWLQFNLVPWLSSEIGIPPPSFADLKTALSELFNNIQDHTAYDIGSIFAQHFPNKKEIIIALSDYGRGIPASVRTRLPNLSDSEAIIQAVQEGFTIKSEKRNRGAGLHFLLNQVAIQLSGHVTIYSGYAIVRFERRGTKITHRTFKSDGYSPGTTIDICLRTDAIKPALGEREDLDI